MVYKYVVRPLRCQGGFKEAPGYFIMESKEELDAGRVFLRSREYIEGLCGAVLESADIDEMGECYTGRKAAELLAGDNEEEPEFYKWKASVVGDDTTYRAAAYIDKSRNRLVLCFEDILGGKRFKSDIYFNDLKVCLSGGDCALVKAVDKSGRKLAVKMVSKYVEFPF